MAVDYLGRVDPGRDPPDGLGRGGAQAGSDHQRGETVGVGQVEVGVQRMLDHLQGRFSGGSSRHREPHVPGARALCGPGGQHGGSGHARTAGDHPAGVVPFVGVGGTSRYQRGHVGPLDLGDGRRRHVQPDVGQHDLPAPRRAVAEQVAGLEGGEGHRPCRPGGPAETPAGEPVDPRRQVDGQHVGIGGRRFVWPAQAGPVGGVDDQVDVVESGRGLGGVDHGDADAGLGEQPGRHPSVGTVAALPGDDGHRSAARQQVDGGCSHRRPGPFDQLFDRHAGGLVDGGHLARGDDRTHGR